LREDAAHALQQVLAPGLGLLGQLGQLALHITLDTTHPRAQRLDRRTHALVLFGMRIAADLRGQARRLAVVVLAQAQAMVLRELDHVLAAALDQAAVRGVGNGLGHHRGVHDHLVQAVALDQASGTSGLNGHSQQQLDAFLADALAPARQARRVDGQLGLQVGLASEELPVGVLQPGVDHHLIGRIVGVLQVQQTGHQPGWQSRTPTARREVASEVVLDQLPVHQPSQTDQRVLHVELLVQARTEHLGGLSSAGVGLHGQRNLQESAGPVFVSLQISHHASAEIVLQINDLRIVQGGLRRNFR